MTEPPLLSLFNKWRLHETSLGVDDYLALVSALRIGIGLHNKERLEELCKLVWVKSEKDFSLFETMFSNYISPSASSPISEKTQTSPKVKNVDTEKQFRTTNVGEKQQTSDVESLNELSLTDEPAKTAQAVLSKGRSYFTDISLNSSRGEFSEYYFPVLRRQMKQTWRQLRKMVRYGTPMELDLDATVYKTGMTGFMLDSVLKPNRVNVMNLQIYVDWNGSMAPFHELSRQFIETIQGSKNFNKVTTFYFHDFPDEVVYSDQTFTFAHRVIENFFKKYDHSVAILISDAGSARQRLDTNRLQRTTAFIKTLKTYVHRIAWLNPIPTERWIGTTAEKIRFEIPMFEMSNKGMRSAVSYLIGRAYYRYG